MRVRRYRGRHLKPRPKRTGPVLVVTATSVSLAGPAHAGPHVVARGETLSHLAARYGTSVAALARTNALADADFIVAGQKLRVPDARPASSRHVVQPGETLSGIAARYRTSVPALARRNKLGDPDLIVSGTTLVVPGGPPVAAPAPPPSGTSVAGSLDRQSVAHGVDPALTKAVAWQESGWRQDVTSSAGAVGVMQVMPGTARFVNRVLGGGKLKVRQADDNVHLGVMYLHHLQGTMRSVRRALADRKSVV